jgi:hypothetical protein
MPIKRIAQRILGPVMDPVLRKLLNRTPVPRAIETHDLRLRALAGMQSRTMYPELLVDGDFPSIINRYESSVYSQHGEDGILLFIFSKIGVTNRKFIEFGVEDGTECNAANLAINFHFNGLLMDGDAENVARGRQFYDTMLGSRKAEVTVAQSWITAENINDTIRSHGISGEIDLLSVDIDGNDYWVWKAIDAVAPRVVVVEYNAALGPNRSITVPYQPNFNRWSHHSSGFYFGASLAAFVSLGRSKGYSLIGCESSGANAFFVRDSAMKDPFNRVDADRAHYYLKSPELRGITHQQQFETIERLPWIEV